MKTDELKTLTIAPGASLRAVDRFARRPQRQIVLVGDADNKLRDYWRDIGRLDDLEAARSEFESVFRA